MELSFGEIVLVALIAFLVLGPDELVRRSRDLGRWVGRIKSQARNFRILAEEELLRASEAKKVAESLNAPIVKLDAPLSPPSSEGEKGSS